MQQKQAQITEVQQALDDVTKRCADTANTNADLTASLQGLEQDKEALRSELIQEQGRVADLEKQVAATESEAKAQVSSLTEQVPPTPKGLDTCTPTSTPILILIKALHTGMGVGGWGGTPLSLYPCPPKGPRVSVFISQRCSFAILQILAQHPVFFFVP